MNLEQAVDYLERRIEEAKALLADTSMSSLSEVAYQEGQLDALKAVLTNINNDVGSKHQSLCYTAESGAFEEYSENGLFYTMIEVGFNSIKVDYAQRVITDILRIDVPEEEIVRMLSCNSKIANGAENNCLYDTDEREAIMGYFGDTLLNLTWPIGATPKETTALFFEKWREKIVDLGWADDGYDYGLQH